MGGYNSSRALRASQEKLRELWQAVGLVQTEGGLERALVTSAFHTLKQRSAKDKKLEIVIATDPDTYHSDVMNADPHKVYVLMVNGVLDIKSLFPYANRVLVQKYKEFMPQPAVPTESSAPAHAGHSLLSH